MLRKGSKHSSSGGIHEKIYQSLIDQRLNDLTSRLFEEEYKLLKSDEQVCVCLCVCVTSGQFGLLSKGLWKG